MIFDKLYDWQQKIIVNHSNKDALGLFLDMGLGKTPLSLAFAEYHNCSKVIVVTINAKAEESSTLSGSWLNWSSQMKLAYKTYTKRDNIDCSSASPELLLVNYESLFSRKKNRDKSIMLKDNIVDFMNKCKGENVALIIDESHKLKNLHSKQTQSILQMKRSLTIKSNHLYTYLLTGTPFTQGYIDLYTQLKVLGCDYTKGRFEDEFCIRGQIPGLLGWQQPIVGYKNLDNLYKLVHKYALTIMSDDIVDLPDKIFQDVVTPLSKDFTLLTSEYLAGNKILDEQSRRKTHDLNIEDFNTNSKCPNPYYRNLAFPEMKWLAETSGTFWLRARQISIGFQGNASDAVWFDKTRLNNLREFLENNPDNYVLFYNFTPELIELYQICEELGYNIDVYCGEIKSLVFYEKYSNQTDEEKLNNKRNVIIANYASGSTGMNWQQYNKCILFSIALYKDYAQCLKRVHRLGQTKTVFYYNFYQDNWLDKSMLKALKNNEQYNEKLFENDMKDQK